MQSHLAAARGAHAEQSGKDLTARLHSLNGSHMTPEAKEKKLREACEGFESIFIQKMWQEMRKSVHQSSLLHGKEEQFWQDMYDQELAKKMTSAGGIGLADMMYEQLSRNLTSASQATVRNQPAERAFVPEAAPLLPSRDSSVKDGIVAGAEPESRRSQTAQNVKEASKQAPLYEAAEQGTATAAVTDGKKTGVAPGAPGPVVSAEAVDPSITQALASMRAQVQGRRDLAPAGTPQGSLANVSYVEPRVRQQPAASGIDMANAARREAGDQLGSHGIREPLQPQTENARRSTANADHRREARRLRREQAMQKKSLPYAYPSGQAEAQDMAERMRAHSLGETQGTEQSKISEGAFAPMSSRPATAQASPASEGRTEQRRGTGPQAGTDSIRTLNLGSGAPRLDGGAPSRNVSQMDSASFVAGRAYERAEGPVSQPRASSAYTIPPLTADQVKM
ncbi:MAG: rod-binding protein [Desulfovibrio sp.]|nr:rod-binding protein [Desulfovibrio sp.]